MPTFPRAGNGVLASPEPDVGLLANRPSAGSLLVGAGANAAVLAGLGGAIVGLVAGALVGMYSGVVINSDVIDLRGQQPAHDVSVSLGQVGQPTNGPPPMGYVAEHQANERQANEHHEEPNRRG